LAHDRTKYTRQWRQRRRPAAIEQSRDSRWPKPNLNRPGHPVIVYRRTYNGRIAPCFDKTEASDPATVCFKESIGEADVNRLQRRNQRVVATALDKPLFVTSIDVSSGRLIEVKTATWGEYWGHCSCVAEETRRLHERWNTFIEGGHSTRDRPPFVQAYFTLLRRCLDGCARGDVDLSVLRKVIGFETFPLSRNQEQLAAGTFNIRNPAYLLSRVALPKAPEAPKFLPLICLPSSPAYSARLFCHYRRIGILGGHRAQLFVYPPVDARDRSSSYRLIAELFASLTPRNDPWVQERIRLLFDGVFADLVAPLQDNRIQLLDVACGTARTTMGLCRRAFAKYGTSFDLTLVDVVRGARSIGTTFYRHPRAFGNIVFRHESLFEWIDGISGSPARFDLVLMLRICDVFSRFQIEELSCREARALIRRERGQSSVDSDTSDPARLIEENRLDKLHDRLWRSPFRNGMVFHQFSLSDYYRAITTILDGGASGVEGMIYAPIRRFDETALVLPSGRSLIGQLMTMANKILIEDSDLTASRLQRHINHFGLSDLSVTDFTDRRGRHGASVVVIGRRQSLRERIATAEMTAASEIGAWHQQDEEGGSS